MMKKAAAMDDDDDKNGRPRDKTVFFQTVFFKTVFLQTVFSQTVFLKTVFFQTVVFQTVISNCVFSKQQKQIEVWWQSHKDCASEYLNLQCFSKMHFFFKTVCKLHIQFWENSKF